MAIGLPCPPGYVLARSAYFPGMQTCVPAPMVVSAASLF
jgi:hypothetical protein